MIKCFFLLAGATIISGLDIETAKAQAPTPVICVSGCAAGTGTVTANQGGTWTITTLAADPCVFNAKTNLPISYQTATSVQLVGLSTGKLIYVCSLALIGSTATVFSLTSGTGTACATATAAVFGAATATNGVSLTSNGGLTLGGGAGTVAIAPAGSELCIVQSGSGNLSGNLTYVQM